jgi:hypothetical protein
VRPFLEAREDRWAPANLLFKGKMSNDRFTPANWIGTPFQGPTTPRRSTTTR